MGCLQLIINADDLGWLPRRDDGIWSCVDRGIVTSVSLMANGAAFSSAVTALRQRNVGLGVHLNLSDGCALTGQIAGLTDDRGGFLGKQRSRRAFMSRCYDVAAAKAELWAQLDRVRQTGLLVDHVDTHQHMMIFPGVTELILALCRESGVTALRLPCMAEPDIPNQPVALRNELLLYRQHEARIRGLVAASRLWTPDGLYGMPLLNRLDEAALLCLIPQLPPGCWELMVHPGEQNAGDPFGGVERKIEQVALLSSRVREALDECRIGLITFGETRCVS
ncbi:MAG: ChbG/HpnK family deacetylase [Desulfuromonadaceae bacterium]|nr:ChbG/HpnK family deacetylase [Desulfuromonadaceae bacterium]